MASQAKRSSKVSVYQCDLHKAKLAQLHVSGKVHFFNKRDKTFIFLI